jgi:hypothetical protein
MGVTEETPAMSSIKLKTFGSATRAATLNSPKLEFLTASTSECGIVEEGGVNRAT